jgi:hypothetical protein
MGPLFAEEATFAFPELAMPLLAADRLTAASETPA